jgi:hypothetical protein
MGTLTPMITTTTMITTTLSMGTTILVTCQLVCACLQELLCFCLLRRWFVTSTQAATVILMVMGIHMMLNSRVCIVFSRVYTRPRTIVR